MSADNWDICPKCVGTEKLRIETLKKEVDDAYLIPYDEFILLRHEAEVPIDLESFRTFREDYEFYGASTGVLQISYSGNCSVCGLDLTFKDTKKVYPHDR